MTGEKRGVRDSMDKMRRQLRENGASSSYAQQVVNKAARTWDRRVEEGSIKPTRPDQN